jgi:4'-phosphopantetheinyl transferase EntD
MILKSEEPPMIIPQAATVSFRYDATAFGPQWATEHGIEIPKQYARAVASRQADFVAGRLAAREAMRKLDLPILSIGVTEQREPVWPSGVVGSITHTGNFVCAALARTTDYQGIGIDAEFIIDADKLAGVSKLVRTPVETALFKKFSFSDAEMTTLCFSAKESVYKCLHPLIGRFMDFKDLEIVGVDQSRKTFAVRVVDASEFGGYSGLVFGVRYTVVNGLVFTTAIYTK